MINLMIQWKAISAILALQKIILMGYVMKSRNQLYVLYPKHIVMA